jgi:hypothetical protein
MVQPRGLPRGANSENISAFHFSDTNKVYGRKMKGRKMD